MKTSPVLSAVALLAAIAPGMMTVAVAHNVEVDGSVAVTMHLEPHHQPKAEVPSDIWFALTRKGGDLIRFDQCDCQLQVYFATGPDRGKRILEPPLVETNVERYQNIPKSQIKFPKPGEYTVQLVGKPKSGATFEKFSVQYPVVVLPPPADSPPSKALTHEGQPAASGPGQTAASEKPKASESKTSEAKASDSKVTESKALESTATEPKAAEPIAAEPTAAEHGEFKQPSEATPHAPVSHAFALRDPLTWVMMLIGIFMFVGVCCAALTWQKKA